MRGKNQKQLDKAKTKLTHELSLNCAILFASAKMRARYNSSMPLIVSHSFQAEERVFFSSATCIVFYISFVFFIVLLNNSLPSRCSVSVFNVARHTAYFSFFFFCILCNSFVLFHVNNYYYYHGHMNIQVEATKQR